MANSGGLDYEHYRPPDFGNRDHTLNIMEVNGKYDGVTMREALQWFGEHGVILQKVPDGWACAWDKNRFTLQSDPYDCIYEAWVSAQKPPTP